MRRKMSALTTTILGAVVTASTVSAQQLPPANQAPRTKSAASETATATEPDADPLFGMTAMRGVRYLLRNGLDYLNYQQYERALKFLREAEKRDGEAEKRGKGELNKTEKLALKQGIERAQRGMRDAADAEVPYALSDRSRRRNGFIAAKSDPQVASNTNPGNGPTPPTHKASRLDQPTRLGNESEDPGEPIRLASADLVSSEPVSQPSASPGSTKTKTALSDHREDEVRPASASQPEIPRLPAGPPLSDLTDSNASLTPSPEAGGQTLAQAPQPRQPVAGATVNQGEVITSLPPLDPASEPAKAEPTPVIQAAVPPSNIQASDNGKTTEPQSPALTGATTPSLAPADAMPLSAPADATPSAAPVELTPTPVPVEIKTPATATTPAPVEIKNLATTPAPVEIKTPATAPASVEIKTPSSGPSATPPGSSGLVQAAGLNPEAGATSTKPTVIDLERISLPPLANNSDQPNNSGDLTHKEIGKLDVDNDARFSDGRRAGTNR